MEKISEHISYKEAVRSSTAKRLGIENTPTEFDLKRMKSISKNVFEPLRTAANGPIRINSFFRSKELNKAVGGSGTSHAFAFDRFLDAPASRIRFHQGNRCIAIDAGLAIDHGDILERLHGLEPDLIAPLD